MLEVKLRVHIRVYMYMYISTRNTVHSCDNRTAGW